MAKLQNIKYTNVKYKINETSAHSLLKVSTLHSTHSSTVSACSPGLEREDYANVRRFKWSLHTKLAGIIQSAMSGRVVGLCDL